MCNTHSASVNLQSGLLVMSAVRDLTRSGATNVAFEVERVGWPSPDRLEVVGRWFGVRGRRFIRPTLHVEVDGEPRRMLAVLDHKPWAVEDGQDWVAAFAWEGEPVDLAGSELTVGPDVAVELLPPGERRPETRRVARRPRADVLETELAAVREKTQRLARELHAARADHAAELVRTAAEHEAELERVRGERAAAEQETEHRAAELRGELDAARDKLARLETALQKTRDELAVARADAATQREGLERERAAMAADAAKAAAPETERLRRERDEARRESAAASAERDMARRESAAARGERDAAIRDRDRARQERQVLLSRVRSEGEKRAGGQAPSAARDATPTIPAPPNVQAAPAPSRAPAPPDTPVPGAAPAAHSSESFGAPAPLAVRIAAIVALIVLTAVVVVLVSWAL